MSTHADPHVPRPALWGAAGLIAFALLGAISVRAGLMAPAGDPQALRAANGAVVVSSARVTFADAADGSVIVRRGAQVVATVPAMSDQGFVRGVLRGLARERRMHGIAHDEPFELAGWSDGSLTLTDLATGRQIELGAFGATNRAAFAQLLHEAARREKLA